MFKIRRTELRLKGNIVPDRVSYNVMIDPAKVLEPEEPKTIDVQGGTGAVVVRESPRVVSILQDLYITLLSDYADVSIGQFKIPISWEGYQSSSKLLFPERALAARQFGDRRDIGLRVEKRLGHFYYFAGLYNGAGQNRPDDNDQKDAALRIEAFPLEWLMIAAVGYSSIGERDQPTTRDAVEGDLRIELDDAIVQAEYIRNWQGSNESARKQAQGSYLAGGYTFVDRYQPVLRVGVLDPDVELKDDHVWHYELGMSYFVQKHEAKLQASYGLFEPARGTRKHEAIVAAQISF